MPTIMHFRYDEMWQDYIGEDLPAPGDIDRARIEKVIGGRLPDAYWELLRVHQGQVLDAGAIPVPGAGDVIFGVLLLGLSPMMVGEDDSYSMESCWNAMRDHYPAGLLPFADDTGGNYWAFDFRLTRDPPAIVFIDHEIEGDDGVIAVAPDFASFWAKWNGGTA